MKVKRLEQEEKDFLIKDAVEYYLNKDVKIKEFSLNYDDTSFYFLYKNSGNTLLIRIGQARSSSGEPVLVTYAHGEIPSNIRELIHPNILEEIVWQ